MTSVTINATLTPATDKVTHVVNDAFLNAISKAKKGGDDLESGYFSKQQDLAEFYDFLAINQESSYVMGTTEEKSGVPSMPTLMIDSGNVNCASLVVPLPASSLSDARSSADPEPGRVGTATIRTGFAQDSTVTYVEFGVSVGSAVGGLVAGNAFWAALAKPVLLNIRTLFRNWMANRANQASPDIPLEEQFNNSEVAVNEAGVTAGREVEPAAVEGVEEAFAAISWLKGVGAFGVMAVLAAIPSILALIEHAMYSQLAILNLTEDELNVNLEFVSAGGADYKPANGKIPPMSIKTDMFGDKSDTKVAYEANFHFMNTNGFGALGYLVSLSTPSGSPAACVIDIPWAGENSLWIGATPAGTPDWANLFATVPKTPSLTQTVTIGKYKLTLATNKTSGETGNTYRYDNLLTVELA